MRGREIPAVGEVRARNSSPKIQSNVGINLILNSGQILPINFLNVKKIFKIMLLRALGSAYTCMYVIMYI